MCGRRYSKQVEFNIHRNSDVIKRRDDVIKLLGDNGGHSLENFLASTAKARGAHGESRLQR